MLNDATTTFVGFVECELPGLDAARLKVKGPVWLTRSVFRGQIDLQDSAVSDVDAYRLSIESPHAENIDISLGGIRVEHDVVFAESRLQGVSIFATGAHIKGSLILSAALLESKNGRPCFFGKLIRIGGNFVANRDLKCIGGAIDIEGADIGGELNLIDALIDVGDGHALSIDHSAIKLGVKAAKLQAKGAIYMHHAEVWCQISLIEARVETRSGIDAIRADHLIVHGTLFLANLVTNAPIMLHGAQIECALNMIGLKVKKDNPRVPAIKADDIKIDGDVRAFQVAVEGALDFENARIGGVLHIGGRWTVPLNEVSILIDRSQTRGLIAAAGFHCDGLVSITEAEINGSLTLNDSTVGGESSKSLDISGSRVNGDLSALRARFHGAIDGSQAQVNGDMRLADAELYGVPAQDASRGTPTDPRRGGRWRGTSLRLRGVRVIGDVDLRGIRAQQTVDLTASTVGQTLNLDGAALEASEGDAITAENARFGQLKLQFRVRPGRPVNLRNASLDVLSDGENTWPLGAAINIEGFRYRQLDSDLNRSQRLQWLRSATPRFSPQPYDQLAEMYRSKGDVDSERDVEYQAVRRMYQSRGVLQRGWGVLQNLTVGFGYRPSRALLWAVLLWLAGTLWFALGVGICETASAQEVASLCPVDMAKHPAWNPALLALDLLMPFQAFGQDNAWHFYGISSAVAVLLTLAGWVLITTIAAAVARSLRQ